MLRNVFVWIFFLSVDVKQKDGSSKVLETFAWLQLLGFIILVLGIFVYNEILVIPYFGFN